ncbi:MAG: 6-phospho-3-hexuloisomerase [Candidatus Fermentimicrarchaeum limneticum]|uniref:6-phospho-3-hexuloisomerase n=1 Tax=Fermentimicrarchaeum limneticum TaxID=2795018 RepID=A0A7D6BLX4_FERL1|nr:MAG: 6-phospho-3-hexuloisomerase [Candidatus Fermentimicrarchaeum limneticum]
MTIHTRMEKLTQKIEEQLSAIDRKSIDQLVESLTNAKRIFIGGAGRSGLVAKAFGMRLMHLGFTVYVIGEVITPAINKEDLLIIVSGSGQTISVVVAARIAKEKGVKIVSITSNPNSDIGKLSDVIVQIKGRRPEDAKRDYEARQLIGNHEPLTPLGTLFELSAMVFLDSIIDELMLRYQKSEDELKKLHADLE